MLLLISIRRRCGLGKVSAVNLQLPALASVTARMSRDSKKTLLYFVGFDTGMASMCKRSCCTELEASKARDLHGHTLEVTVVAAARHLVSACKVHSICLETSK